MTEYVLISTAALAAVVLLGFLVRRAPGDSVSCVEVFTLEVERVETLSDRESAEMLGRIFSAEDERFVSECSDVRLAQVFRQERKRLALQWIARNKMSAAAIMRRHREASRAATDLQIGQEVRLFLRYLRFGCACEFLSLFVWAFGPSRFRALARWTDAICQGMRTLRDLEMRSARRVST